MTACSILAVFIWFIVQQATKIGEKNAEEKAVVLAIKQLGTDMHLHIAQDNERFGDVQKQLSDQSNTLKSQTQILERLEVGQKRRNEE